MVIKFINGGEFSNLRYNEKVINKKQTEVAKLKVKS